MAYSQPLPNDLTGQAEALGGQGAQGRDLVPQTSTTRRSANDGSNDRVTGEDSQTVPSVVSRPTTCFTADQIDGLPPPTIRCVAPLKIVPESANRQWRSTTFFAIASHRRPEWVATPHPSHRGRLHPDAAARGPSHSDDHYGEHARARGSPLVLAARRGLNAPSASGLAGQGFAL